MPKISEFIIGIIFCSFIMAVFGLFMSEANTKYGVQYDNSSMEAYNKMQNMSALAKNIEESSNIEERSGLLDIIGGYFTGAYNVLKISKLSFNVFESMSNRAIDDAHLGQAGQFLRIAVSASILIIIVLGVIIAAIVKWEV